MKGVVFTEFIDMVEEKFGYETVDVLLRQEGLSSNGAYTAVGTYPHSELVKLVMALHEKTGIPVPALLKAFGNYLFQTFRKGYGAFFENANNAFNFLESIENYIHVEVLKLYPDAELPRFESKRIEGNTLQLDYFSDRRMADFAEGLIESTFEHFEEKVHIQKSNQDERGAHVRFLLKKLN